MFLKITARIVSAIIFKKYSGNFNLHFTLSLKKTKKVKLKNKLDHEVNKTYPLSRRRSERKIS